MKTLLLICAESEAQISRQFINAAIDAKIADQVVATSFDKLEESVRTSEGIDQILIFPALIALPDAMRENLLQRIATLQNEAPQTRILLTSPLGGDPRLFDMIQDRMAAARKSTQNTPILTIETPNTSRTLDFENFATLPDQITDISTLVPTDRDRAFGYARYWTTHPMPTQSFTRTPTVFPPPSISPSSESKDY